MENNSRKNKIFRITIRFATVFIAVIAFLTYFSSTLNRALMPTVETVKVTSGTLSQDIRGTAMLNGADNGGKMYFSFDITKQQRKYFADDTLIEVSFDAFDELHKQYVRKSEMTAFSKINYNKDKDNYTVTADMPDVHLEVGEIMPSVYDDIFYSVSVSSDYYDAIVPQSAVCDGSVYLAYINEEEGTAQIQQESVDVIASDDLYCAVRGNIYGDGDSVVISATKEIKSGDTVVVKGNEK